VVALMNMSTLKITQRLVPVQENLGFIVQVGCITKVSPLLQSVTGKGGYHNRTELSLGP
jgi:hypothetical protein